MGLGLGKKRKEMKQHGTSCSSGSRSNVGRLSCLVVILSSFALWRFCLVLSCACACTGACLLCWFLSCGGACLALVLVVVLVLACGGACLVLVLRLLRASTITVRKLHHLRHISNLKSHYARGEIG